jgi:hypothetical protein
MIGPLKQRGVDALARVTTLLRKGVNGTDACAVWTREIGSQLSPGHLIAEQVPALKLQLTKRA